MEQQVHGRTRVSGEGDEAFFGVTRQMYRARLTTPLPGAQWTGITSHLAQQLLKSKTVEALLTVAPDADDRWKPVPVLVTQAEDVANCRGMRMGYAPLLALLDEVRARGIKKLAIVGIPCQAYALRALEKEYGLESLFVVGIPCSDNTTTERFHEFLGLLDENPQHINYLEFRADYHVELRFDSGEQREIPFLKLPLSKLASDFFPLTCRTCVDYTNTLADITIGYMAGEGDQWLIVRNSRGAKMLSMIEADLDLEKPGSSGRRNGAVKGFKKNVELAAGGLPLRQMPDWLRPVMAWVMPRVGPRGLEFARARVEMKAIESVLHLRRERPRKIKSMVPRHVWKLVERYGLIPRSGEIK